jgi:hypothetical protein
VAKSKDFNDLLLCSIDEALLSLGESVKQSIYFHIKNRFMLTREDIPENLSQFQYAIEKIFGLGARYLEILIMKNLYTKIGCPLTMNKNDQLEFIKYVDAARKNYLKNGHDPNNY